MIALESVVDAIAIPAAPDGWFEYRYTALSDGRLILVRTRKDIHAEYVRWSTAVNAGDYARTLPDLWDDDLLVSIFDGVTETDFVTMPSGSFPIVDRMVDGRWLVVAVHAAANEKNGRIYAPDGRKEHEIHLGDGIETLLCSSDSTIWVGYCDEGIFKGKNKDGSWPVSTGGIVQFDAMGTPLWSFNEQVRDGYAVADSYAITLAGHDLWACFYTDFPIARIREGETKFWLNDVSGAKAIAVQDDIVLLGGGYGRDASCISVLQLGGDRSHLLGIFAFTPGKPGTAALLQGRGESLHVVSNGQWFRLPVQKAVDACSYGRHA
jgi:hypothetical protein